MPHAGAGAQCQVRVCPVEPSPDLETSIQRLKLLNLRGDHQKEGCAWMLSREFATAANMEGWIPKEGDDDLPTKKNKKRRRINVNSGHGNKNKKQGIADNDDNTNNLNMDEHDEQSSDKKIVKGGILADSVGLGKTFIASGVIAANPKKYTLVVTLPSTTIQWCDTIIAFTGIKPHSYLSTRLDRLIDTPEIVVTTYNCARMRPPWLMNTLWDRIILDEGHVIRNPKTATFYSLSLLQADIKWVLSATPVHNGDNDIRTLFEWIGFDTCTVELNTLTRNFMLRRTMETERHRTPEVNLPPLEVEDIFIELSEEELQAYKAIETSYPTSEKGGDGEHQGDLKQVIIVPTTARHEDALSSSQKNGRMKKNGDLLRRISQMRQLCVSEHVLIRAKETREQMDRVDSDFAEDDYDIAEMGVCVPLDESDKAAFGTMTEEKRENDHMSIEGGSGEGQHAYNNRTNKETPLNADEVSKLIDQSMSVAPSPKLSTKMTRLCDMVSHDLAEDSQVKIVIFTTFLSEMDLLFKEMGKRSIGCARIHGGLSPLQRNPQIQTFANKDSGISVLLAQIMCTSTGLNLQCASIAYITSPSWNPCIEEQAVGRLHRQGQTRPVKIRRLIMKDTVEMRCLDIQQKKIDVIRKNVMRSALITEKDEGNIDNIMLQDHNSSIAAAAVEALAARGNDEAPTDTGSDADALISAIIRQNAEEIREQRKEGGRDVNKLSIAELHALAGVPLPSTLSV